MMKGRAFSGSKLFLFDLIHRELGRFGFAAGKSHFKKKCESVCAACTCVHVHRVSVGVPMHTHACVCKGERVGQEAEGEGRAQTNVPPSVRN